MPREPGLLSIAAPMHDEEGTAAAFHQRVVAAVEGIPFELVIVDDGSRDGTPRALAELAAADERVKVVTLSRNFGHQAALTAALEHTSGDVVVMLDGDLACGQLVERHPDLQIYWGAQLGLPDEALVAGRLISVIDDILRIRGRIRAARGWVMDTYLLRPVADQTLG